MHKVYFFHVFKMGCTLAYVFNLASDVLKLSLLSSGSLLSYQLVSRVMKREHNRDMVMSCYINFFGTSILYGCPCFLAMIFQGLLSLEREKCTTSLCQFYSG